VSAVIKAHKQSWEHFCTEIIQSRLVFQSTLYLMSKSYCRVFSNPCVAVYR